MHTQPPPPFVLRPSPFARKPSTRNVCNASEDPGIKLQLAIVRRLVGFKTKAIPSRDITVQKGLSDLQVCASLVTVGKAKTDLRRARRIKCDEHKPMCWRCVKGGRLCGGYGQPDRPKDGTALQPALTDGAQLGREAERLRHLASLVMSLDRHGQPLYQDRVWGRPFLQFSHAVGCVKAAAAAFGAAYESLLQGRNPQDHPPTLYHYGSALRRLQSSVTEGTAGAESCALASLMLACVEILSQHEQNAFAHFLGACQILDIRRRRTSSDDMCGIFECVRNELVMIDVMVGSYTMSQTPAFMHVEPQEQATTNDAFNRPESAIKTSAFALHRAYRLIGRAGTRRYKGPHYVEDDSIFIRDRIEVVSELRSVYHSLETLTQKLEAQISTAEAPNPEVAVNLAEIYALRCQLTSSLIFILSIHSPFETAYDEHQSLFRSIISDAAAAKRTGSRVRSGAFSLFSCRPGVLGPLFLVSMKCRDPSVRRIATAILKEQGREGPADGQTMAAIGARLGELEESARPLSVSRSCYEAHDIHEDQRIHGYSIDGPQLFETGKRIIRVSFSIPEPPILQGWGIVDYSSGGSWSFLSETLDI